MKLNEERIIISLILIFVSIMPSRAEMSKVGCWYRGSNADDYAEYYNFGKFNGALLCIDENGGYNIDFLEEGFVSDVGDDHWAYSSLKKHCKVTSKENGKKILLDGCDKDLLNGTWVPFCDKKRKMNRFCPKRSE